MKIAVQILSPPQASASQHAFNYCQAALANGHDIYRLFFYSAGVLNCIDNAANNLPQQWQRLIAANGLDALACVNSAAKHSIQTTPSDANTTPLLSSFAISGLAQWVDAIHHADRCVTFGA